MATSASNDYLALFQAVHSSKYLLRAVSIRSYKRLHSLDFVGSICKAVLEISAPYCLKDICRELRRSYSIEELRPLCEIIEDKMKCLTVPYMDERAYLDALYEIGCLSKQDLHHLKAQSFEKEYDTNIANKEPNTIYPNNVEIIQSSFNEINSVKEQYKDDYQRIRMKLISEKKESIDNLHRLAPKFQYSLSDDQIKNIKRTIKEANIKSPMDLFMFIRSIPIVPKLKVDNDCKKIAQCSPLLSILENIRLGDKGQTIGKADPVESQRIHCYFYYRLEIKQLVLQALREVHEYWRYINENDLGQTICDNCKSSIIENERIPVWAQGIIAGMQGDFIVSVHLLIPQIERYLVLKAESICGSLLNLSREDHQDEVGFSKALECLKLHFKEDLYNDFRFFFNMGDDVNLRNNVAHGIISPQEIIVQGPYCLWIAIKLFFSEEEIFLSEDVNV